jgi:hypothetical protein
MLESKFYSFPAHSLVVWRVDGLEETKLELTQPSLVELGLGLSLAIEKLRTVIFPGKFRRAYCHCLN